MTAMTTSKTSRPNSSDSSVFSRITDNEFVKLQKYRGTSLFYSSLNFGAHLLLAPVALIMNVLWCITSPLFVLIRALSGDLERNKKPDPNKKSELNKLAFFFAFMREFSPIDMIHMLTCGANNKLIKHISPDLDQNKYAKDSLESQMYKFYSEESKNKENVIYYTGHTFAFAFAKTLFIVPRIIIAAAQFILNIFSTLFACAEFCAEFIGKKSKDLACESKSNLKDKGCNFKDVIGLVSGYLGIGLCFIPAAIQSLLTESSKALCKVDLVVRQAEGKLADKITHKISTFVEEASTKTAADTDRCLFSLISCL